MKNSRFLCEFDTVDTIATRNLSEKRKLQEHLDALEKELHHNLVKMETEMLSIRLENSEEVTRRRKVNPAGVKNVNSPSRERKNGKGVLRQVSKQVDSGSKRDMDTREVSHGILPKITTSSYLTAEQDFDFERKTEGCQEAILGRARSMETISELNQKQLFAERRILTSLNHRPHSQQKYSGSRRPATPQAHSPSRLTPATRGHNYRHPRGSWDSRIESKSLLAPLPVGYSSNNRLLRVHSAPDIPAELNQSQGKMSSRGTQDDKGEPEAVEIPAIFENGAQSSVQSKPGRFIDFDDVVNTRVALFKDGIPDESEMRKIRYLRYKGGTAVNEEMANTLSVFDKK